MLTLQDDLLEDLTSELSVTSPTFNQAVMILKIKNAIREVRQARHYPNSYTESAIAEDLENYYSNIRQIALYDYNMIGADFEESHSENSVSRSWTDRDKLFSGIIPISRWLGGRN